MNKNNLLFDDLKMDNVLEVDNIIKISDFNSIVKFNTLTKDKIYKMQLGVSVYFSYLPILNKLVEYFLDVIHENRQKNSILINNNKDNIIKKEKNEVTHKLNKINTIINEIKYEEQEFVKYIRYKKIIFKKIEYFLSLQKINYESIKIPTICHYDICTNKFTYNSKNININIYEILSNILFSVNFTENEYYYKLYLDILSKYLLKKYDNIYTNCINNLLQRINIYCVGHLLIEFISAKIDMGLNNNNEINRHKSLEKIFHIIALCCLNIFKINDKIYITEPNINYILNIVDFKNG